MGKLKQKPLEVQLEEELAALTKLRGRITELRHDVDYTESEIVLYYAVDFSEIFSYLHYDEQEDRNIIGVTLDLQDQESRFLQYRLALTHLFNSFADTLYVLPSHTIEMWTYARTQGTKKSVAEDQVIQLAERARNLDPELRELLNSLKDETLTEEDSRQLLTFVKSSEFSPLCVDVSEFVNSYKRGNALRSLLSNGRISTHIDKILAKHKIGFGELKEPSEKEITQVYQAFPRISRHLNPFSTRVDARAFLYLRNINQLLARANARLILITRDVHLLDIAQSVSEDSPFQWDEARQCLRGIESVFLDLTLSGSVSRESRRQWILDSDMKLASMQESILRTLNRMKTERAHSQLTMLTSMGKKLLKQTAQLWDQQINLKLSLASTFIPWLERTFQDISSGEDLPERFKAFRQEYQILTNLLEYFSSPVYRTIASRDVKAIWNTIEMDCLRLGFLDVLGEEGADRLSQLLTQTFRTSSGERKTIIHSKHFFKMPSLQLVSKTYREKLKSLATENGEHYERAFFSIIREVVSGFNEPEDFLIMAFLLGLLNEWEQALEVMNKCRQIIANMPPSSVPEQIIPSEVDFLSSAIKRRLAQTAADAESEISLYLDAYDDIVRARTAAPNEPRYLVAEAGTAMMYHEIVNNVCLWPIDAAVSVRNTVRSDILSEAEAKEQTKRALGLINSSDVRLRVIVLNNLAFAEVLSENPSLEEADVYIGQADEIIQNADHKQAALLSGVLLHINETKVMLRAKRARYENNLEGLKECIQDLYALAEETDLIEYEKRGFLSHLEILKSWLVEVERQL